MKPIEPTEKDSFEQQLQSRHVYTVSEITRGIKIILEDSFPAIWVEGEVSNLRQPLSGHMYFTLKDNFSQLACVLFKSVNHQMKFKLEDGLQVIGFGRISLYEKTGQYQLYVEKIEPKGLGALQLAFQQLKMRLSKEGLFDPGHKVSIPSLPTRIGVVTSPTGAAIRDILQVLSRRFANLQILLYPVQVQGDEAAAQIARAIADFNQLKLLSDGQIPEVDVLIVGRGGGSMEDLWAFNEEIVARAIYNSKIPVISAVGHEIDWTIADFVADLRAPTPSAAAELVIAKKDELIQQAQGYLSRIEIAIFGKLELLESELSALTQAYCFRQPLNMVLQRQQALDELTKELSIRMAHYIKSKSQQFQALVGKMEALSPLGILSRGYSITRKLPKKEILKDVKTLKKNDLISTKLSKGSLISRVEKID